MATTAPDAWASPADLALDAEWLPAVVPGTVAGALAAAGSHDLDRPEPLHDRDHWFVCRIEGEGRRRLVFDGLATFAEVFLDGRPILESRSMFLPAAVDVDLDGEHELAIVFRALGPRLDAVKPKRARWRSVLVPDQRLRAVRTTLLGHMPGWCPAVDVIGPWRSIRVVDPADPAVSVHGLATRYDGRDGRLEARLALSPDDPRGAAAHLGCAGRSAPFFAEGGAFVARLDLPGIAPWWPATHGDPVLHDVDLEIDGRHVPLGRTGFRTIAVERGPDGRGFGFRINGVEVFARGVVHVPADPLRLPAEREAIAADLVRMRDAGLNTIRVSGIGAYEAGAFHDLCDELGLMVWQDLMFANFDYPAADPDFVGLVRGEAEALFDRLALSPSLALVCGGSEITQQAAMTGLPPASWGNALFDEVLPEIARRRRPDVAWLRSTPDGGAMPFSVSEGVGHYFGVGAYRRPLADARTAEVRFAAECLAFAHVPEAASLDEGLSAPAVHHPDWKRRVPRDHGAAWDFEDIRLHYEALLFGDGIAALRLEDPARALDVGRMTTAAVVEAVLDEWRRPGSPTRGALAFLHRDMRIGAGWGFVDAAGRPKSSWWALARASRPVRLILADEGVNGFELHLLDDTAAPVRGRLELAALADGRRPVVSGAREVEVSAHGHLTLAATDLLGGFFDLNRAYRFGPPAHDTVVARLVGAEGEVLAETIRFVEPWSPVRRPAGLTVRLDEGADGFALVVGVDRAVRAVVIEDAGFEPADSWFAMAPGERRIRLIRRAGVAEDRRPAGRVRLFDARESVAYRAAGG
jgi:beta-mannosidase